MSGRKVKIYLTEWKFWRIAKEKIKDTLVDNAKEKKKGGKTIEWENPEIFQNLEIPMKYVMQRWAQKDKMASPLTEAEEVRGSGRTPEEGLYKKKF